MIDFLKIKKILEDDKVIIYPTESLYGFGSKYDSKKAKDKIYSIKERGSKKPFLLLINSYQMAEKLVYISDKKKEFLKRYWPGHLTVIFNSINSNETIAIRYPNTVFLNQLFKFIDFPITSTSVNRSGEKPYSDILKIKKEFSKEVDLIIDLPVEKEGKASTIIDFTGEKPIVIRSGDIQI